MSVSGFGWMSSPDQKRCRSCGRIGTRDFVQTSPGPSWMGPWVCKWDGPCWERQERKRRAEEAQRPEPPDVIDLDTIQG